MGDLDLPKLLIFFILQSINSVILCVKHPTMLTELLNKCIQKAKQLVTEPSNAHLFVLDVFYAISASIYLVHR